MWFWGAVVLLCLTTVPKKVILYYLIIYNFATFILCVQDINVSEEPSADQTDLSASPPLPYVAPTSLSLSDITVREPQDGLSHSDVTDSLTNSAEEENAQQGSSLKQNKPKDKCLETDGCDVIQGKLFFSVFQN